MTKLEAVCEVLAAIGRGNVTALDTDGASDASFAERVIDRKELEVQTRGWRFNSRKDVTLTPDGSDHIALPSATITIQMGSRQVRSVCFVQLGARLFDTVNNVDTFDGTVQADYILRFDFDCIPQPIQKYITRLAAEEFNNQYGGSLQAIQSRKQSLALETREAKCEANRYEDTAQDVNVLATYDAWATRGFRERNPGGEISMRL